MKNKQKYQLYVHISRQLWHPHSSIRIITFKTEMQTDKTYNERSAMEMEERNLKRNG